MPQVQIQRAQPQRIREKEEEEREFIDQVERLDHFSFHFSSTTVALAYIGKGISGWEELGCWTRVKSESK
jgi:hypothetical protein